MYRVLGVLPEGTKSVTLTLSLSTPDGDELLYPRFGVQVGITRRDTTVWSGEVVLPVELIARRPPEPVSSPEIDAAVRESLKFSAMVSKVQGAVRGDEPRFGVYVSGGRAWSGPLESVPLRRRSTCASMVHRSTFRTRAILMRKTGASSAGFVKVRSCGE